MPPAYEPGLGPYRPAPVNDRIKPITIQAIATITSTGHNQLMIPPPAIFSIGSAADQESVLPEDGHWAEPLPVV